MDVEIEVTTPLNNRTYQIIKLAKSRRIFIEFIKQTVHQFKLILQRNNRHYGENKWIECKQENEWGIY